MPCLAVSGFAASWALANGLGLLWAVQVFAVGLLGQLSVGWSNDALDAPRDTVAGRRDKPIPAGLVGRRTVAVAAGVAAAACVPASLTLGALGGGLHLLAVASAWAYNLGLKATLVSPVPYAVSFALLPSVVVRGVSGWVSLAAGLLGMAAHFANTVADTDADHATGVRGLPQRIGPHRSLRLTAVLLATAAACLLFGADRGDPPGAATLPAAAGAVLALLVAAAGPRLGRRAFPLIVAAVALVVGGFLVGRG